MGVYDEEIVDVATNDDEFVAFVAKRFRAAANENTRVGVELCESLGGKPREDASLPPSASLGHAINGFLHAAGFSRCAVAGRSLAVDDLARLEAALQVR